MKIILKQCLRIWHLFTIAFIFALTYPFLYYYSRKQSRYEKLNFFRKICALGPSVLSGVFYRFHYETAIDWSKNYVVCPNHSSNLDIFTMSLVMKNNFFFLGKEELLKNPVTAIFFKTIDIPINRDSKMASFKAFKKTSERIKEGMSPVIFPEGTIGENYPPKLLPFKNGPFRLAIEHQIDIVPVTIKNNWKIIWDDGKASGFKPGIVDVYIHAPIATNQFTLADDEQLKELTYKKIASKIDYKL